jgi:hypothetical protein
MEGILANKVLILQDVLDMKLQICPDFLLHVKGDAPGWQCPWENFPRRPAVDGGCLLQEQITDVVTFFGYPHNVGCPL